MKRLLALLLAGVFITACAKDPVVSLGSERSGYAIPIDQAIDIARPYLYKSYTLRNPESTLSEGEYYEKNYFQIFVLVEQEHYIIFRDLPKKLSYQHLASPVKINMFNGEVVAPK
jgi:hypothetical protein